MTPAKGSAAFELDRVKIQIFPDISQATLDRRRKMKEVHSAYIRYHWGFPFKLMVPHNGTTYMAYNVTEGKELLMKLGFLQSDAPSCHLSTLGLGPLWATPSSYRNKVDGANYFWTSQPNLH